MFQGKIKKIIIKITNLTIDLIMGTIDFKEEINIIITMIQKIQIKVLNVGHQDLEITSWGIYVNKNFQLNIFNLNNASSSYLVPIGKSINLSVPLSTLTRNIMEYKEEIDGTAKIKFFVQTNYGKTYLTKINYCFSFFLK